MDEDERELWSRIGGEIDRSIAVRGSTAEAYDGRGPLVKCVPPLGDLDIVIGGAPARAGHVALIMETLWTELPAYRFIHVDVLYADAARKDGSTVGNVELIGLPEVFVYPPDVRSERGESVTANVQLRNPGMLFRDFLYVLRKSKRYESLKETVRDVANLLKARDPMETGASTRGLGAGRELMRIDKALVKHVFFTKDSMFKYLPSGWLIDFASFLNPVARKVILGEWAWLAASVTSYSANGVVKSLEFTNPDQDSESLAEPVREWAVEKSKLSPSLDVRLPEPPEPGCCEYRDFREGIAEMAFNRRGGNGDNGTLLDLALAESRERVHVVHAQAAACGRNGVWSLRTDPGFMGILCGRRARLYGVWT